MVVGAVGVPAKGTLTLKLEGDLAEVQGFGLKRTHTLGQGFSSIYIVGSVVPLGDSCPGRTIPSGKDIDPIPCMMVRASVRAAGTWRLCQANVSSQDVAFACLGSTLFGLLGGSALSGSWALPGYWAKDIGFNPSSNDPETVAPSPCRDLKFSVRG